MNLRLNKLNVLGSDIQLRIGGSISCIVNFILLYDMKFCVL